MNKPLTVMIIDGATWYSEDDWKALVAQKLELEATIEEAKLAYYGVTNQWSDPFEDDDGSDETWSKYVSNALKQLGDILEGGSDG